MNTKHSKTNRLQKKHRIQNQMNIVQNIRIKI